jgi:hypothetical protein
MAQTGMWKEINNLFIYRQINSYIVQCQGGMNDELAIFGSGRVLL